VSTGRLEAFSDGVIAILITIMVLDLRALGRDLKGKISPALYAGAIPLALLSR